MRNSKRHIQLPGEARFRTGQASKSPNRGGRDHNWTINIRLLVLTLAVLAILVPSLYAVHSMQVNRGAGVLFERAQALEKSGELSASAQTLFQYLKLRPDDGPARVLLAQVFDKTAKTPNAKERATQLYASALVSFPDRLDLRTRLAEILIELSRSKDAQKECLLVLFGDGDFPPAEIVARLKPYIDRSTAAKLLEANPDAAKALRILAQARFEIGKTELDWSPTQQLVVAKCALSANPQNVELTILLALIYRQRLLEPSSDERAKTADALVNAMVEGHPNPGKANLAVHRYRVEFGLSGADEALISSLTAEPQNIEILLTAAERAKTTSDTNNATSYFKRAIAVTPKDPRAHAGLAQLLLSQGKTDEAMVACKEGLKVCGSEEIGLNMLLLNGTIHSGQLADAETLLRTVRSQQEVQAPFMTVAGRTRVRDAIAALDAELAIAKNELLRAAGILQQLTVQRSGEMKLAEDLRVRGERWARLGHVYEKLQYFELAARAYEQQSLVSSDSFAAKIAAGKAWAAAGRIDSAVDSFAAALEESNANSAGWLLLAQAELQRQLRRTDRDWSRLDAEFRVCPRS